jgi:hypothetical protein
VDKSTATYVPPDPTKVEIGSRDALTFWSRTLQTDEEKLRRAVAKVGPMLEAVKEELGIGGVG